MNTTDNLMLILPSTTFTLNNQQQQQFDEQNSNLPSILSLSNSNQLHNNDIKPMMITQQQQQPDDSEDNNEFFNSSQVAMSSMTYMHPQFDNQHQHYHQRQSTITSVSTLTNNLNDDEQCQICGDLASGWHCGAITCEACKKFFLRSMSTGDGKKKYKCQRELTCSITKRSRTQCQYCRFQKCLTVGMKPHESIGPKTEDLYKKLPCLVCSAAASGIHFGAVTCEACKGFFRRSVKENAPERYRCAENNNCEINSTSKITCRACRYRKCVNAGMSMEASRIGRQSNLFKESIRQLQNGTSTMATVKDSARIASMAKKRKTKARNGRVFASNNEIDLELSLDVKEYIRKVHDAYVLHLKDLPRCIPRRNIWLTMASQLIVYAQAVMNFCQKTIPDFTHLSDPYEIISSCINSVIMITLLPRCTSGMNRSSSSSLNSFQNTWNYWRAETTLALELNAYVPQLTEAEHFYRSFELKLKDLQLDEKELALLLLMLITRTNMNIMNGENKTWPTCQLECVQAFSAYTQARRPSTNGELPVEFYDIAFLISQLRTLNRRISQCLVNLPWPKVPHLPSFFYRIYVPSVGLSPSLINNNNNNSSTIDNHHHNNHLFSDPLNSNTMDIGMMPHNYGSNNETNFWPSATTTTSAQTSWCASNPVTNRHCSPSSSSSESSSPSPHNVVAFDSRPAANLSDDITVSIRW